MQGPRARAGFAYAATRALLVGALLAHAHATTGCAATTPPAASWARDTEAGWQAMHTALAGKWRATTPQSRTIDVSYRVVSNGSAIVETFTSSSGKETVSVYHHDGGMLMLTHYCAQGNQARLRAVEATRDRIVLVYLDATNVRPDQAVMRRLVFVLRPDGFDQESTYRSASGEDETSTLHFFRAE